MLSHHYQQKPTPFSIHWQQRTPIEHSDLCLRASERQTQSDPVAVQLVTWTTAESHQNKSQIDQHTTHTVRTQTMCQRLDDAHIIYGLNLKWGATIVLRTEE